MSSISFGVVLAMCLKCFCFSFGHIACYALVCNVQQMLQVLGCCAHREEEINEWVCKLECILGKPHDSLS